jgi:hypothetical protein
MTISLLCQPLSDATQSHHVARCQWQTRFDGDRQGGWQLQEILSHWSNTVLKGLLDRYFSRYCPEGYHWRIDQLTLDLGTIEYDQLTSELVKRVGEALTEQLPRLLQQAQWQTQSNDPLTTRRALPNHRASTLGHPSQLLDHQSSAQAFLAHYLRVGTVPWWHQGTQGHRELLTGQLASAPTQVATMIRQLSRNENVRKRLVWQYYPEPLNEVIKVLEPYHHQVIDNFAERLIELQQQHSNSGRLAARRQSWYWILTHLLVERGSLFNTTAFVMSTVQQMAHHYQLDYATLLRQMLEAAQGMQRSHPQLPVFIQALLGAEQQLTKLPVQGQVSVPVVDHWQTFTRLLSGNNTNYTNSTNKSNTTGSDNLAETFGLLAREDAQRMATLLRREGRREAVRTRIVSAFSKAELAAVVVVLVPNDHTFVLSHIAHSKAILHAQISPSDTALVWQMVLAYLLKNSASYFNRRQFVGQTLRHWSQARGLDYGLLLDLLATVPPDYQGSVQRFELRAILTDLKQQHYTVMSQQSPQQTAQHISRENKHKQTALDRQISRQRSRQDRHKQIALDSQIVRYAQQLRRYLSHGQLGQARLNRQDGQGNHESALLLTPQALLVILLYRDPQGLSTLLREGWAQSRHSSRWLSRLVGLLSLADAPVLLRTLLGDVADIADWLLPLLELDGEQGPEHGLAQGLETALMLLLSQPVQGMSINSVLTSLKALSPGLISVLQRSQLFAAEQSGLSPNKTALDKIVLNKKTFSEIQRWLQQQSGDSAEQQNLSAIEQILCLLRGQRLSGITLAQGLNQHLPSQGGALILALQRDLQSSQLAHTLLQQMDEVPAVKGWLVAIWPKEVMPAPTLLSLLSKRLQASGLCQGSITRLEQLLHQQLWLTVLTQAMTSNMTANDFWRHLVSGLMRPLALSQQQLFTALAGKTGQAGKTGEAGYHSDVMAQAISAAHAGDGWINGQSESQNLSQGQSQSQSDSSNEVSANQPWVIDAAGRYLQQPILTQVLTHWLRYGRAPLWWSSTPALSLSRLLADVLAFAPSMLVIVLRQSQSQTQSQGHNSVVRRLAHLMDFSALIKLMGQVEPALAAKLSVLARIDDELKAGLLSHIKPTLGDLPRLLLWQYTVQAWLGGGSSHWQALAPEAVISAVYGQLIDRYPQTKTALAEAFSEPFAAYFETPAETLTDTPETAATTAETTAQMQKKIQAQMQQQLNRLLPPLTGVASGDTSTDTTTPLKDEPMTMHIAVSNAGLVIIQNFIAHYFSKLELTDKEGFVSEQAQLDAVHWLQYLATGYQNTDETHLVLNKVLCGLPLSTPVASGIEVSPAQQELTEGLINAVIQYWSAIGSSSIEGFRGNWLVRDALLSETEENWELVVEKRPYDLLLDRLPFGYSLVSLPWMDKPLYVTWPT